ncbi:MAG: cation:proton antiporter [Candidatus Aminicenantes bacterium]|nr:cation:proton antiporter [Candidatus Aminicenantes bacterium]
MNIIVLIVLFLLMLFLKSTPLEPFAELGKSSSLSLGFILVFAFLLGKKIKQLSLPRITGFILAGIFCGPYIMKFLSTRDVQNLQLLDGLALSLIALTAGGEMRISELKKYMRTLVSIVFFQTSVIIVGFTLFCFIGGSLFPFLAGKTMAQTVAFSLLLGTLATATSPSTTIAVINELKAKGKITDLVLSAAVVKDFAVIVLFAFSLSFSKGLLSPEKTFDAQFLLHILRDVGGSILIGLAVGGGIILYLRFIKEQMAVFILAVAFFTYQVSHNFGFHPLMICLLAGFIVENFSSQGEKFIQAIEKSSLPIYVIFFAISGASLNMAALQKTWFLALIIVVLRGILKYSGTYIGARLARAEQGIRKKSWAGFISQAGVALGMAVIIERTFPQWGDEFKALILAVIAINQIFGPILLQRLINRAEEAGKK